MIPDYLKSGDFLHNQYFRFVIQFASFAVASVVIKHFHRNLIKVVRREGIELHIISYKKKIGELTSQKSGLIPGSDFKEINKQIRHFISLTRALTKWGKSGNERKFDIIYGHYLILAGVFLFLEMTLRGVSVKFDPEVRFILFLFMCVYLLAFINIVKRIEQAYYLDKIHIESMSKIINLSGDISLIFILTITSLFHSWI
jgi:hypothetical protein